MPSMPQPKRRKGMHERTHVEKRYNTTQWRQYRRTFLSRNPLCVQCGRVATVVDHITPVRLGGEFWAPDNHAAMCAACHNAKSGSESKIPHKYGPGRGSEK